MADSAHNKEDMLFVGTVLHTMPEMGLALVRRGGGNGTVHEDYVGYYNACDCEYGAQTSVAYPVGASVLCVKGYSGGTIVCYIVGAVNLERDFLGDSAEYRKLHNLDTFMQNTDAKSTKLLMEKMLEGSTDWVKNHAHGMSADALPGDVSILDKNGNCGLYISRLMAQLFGSPLSYVSVDADNNKVRTFGETIERHALLHEEVLNSMYSVSNTAVSMDEANGIVNNPGLRPKIDEANECIKIDQRLESSIPLYRIQDMSGPVIHGVEHNIVMLDEERAKNDHYLHTAKTEPSILSRLRRGFEGELSSASSHSIMSVKTPFVSGIQQLGYGSQPSDTKTRPISTEKNENDLDDLREPYEFEEEQPKTETTSDIMDAALNKLISNILTGEYRTAVINALKQNGFSMASSKASVAGREDWEGESPMGGVCNGPHYEAPAHVDIEDPATGVTTRYYSSLSFISQEPDGSICICDGYGSEIRMSQGNIYISPALDLIVRPGRDASVMAARHASVNAQETVTINATTSAYIRANNDLKMASGTSGTGNMTIECLAKAATSGYPGITINSGAHMSMTAYNDIIIARKTPGGADKEVMTNADISGQIVIDAGPGNSLYMRGDYTILDSQNTTICATNGVTGSVLTIDQNIISMYAEQVWAPTTFVVAPHLANTASEADGASYIDTAYIIRNGQRVPITVKMGECKECRMYLDGLAVLNQDLYVNGMLKINKHDGDDCGLMVNSIRCNSIQGSLTSGGISRETTYEEKDEVTGKTVKKTVRTFADTDIARVPLQEHIGDVATSTAVNTVYTVYQDYYTAVNGFRFPISYDVWLGPMPGMVWQEYSEASEKTGDPWKEVYCIDALNNVTAAYPGHYIWDNQVITSRGKSSEEWIKVSENGYRTNTKHGS